MTTLKISITEETLKATQFCSTNSELGKNCAIAYEIRNIFPEAWVEKERILPFKYREGFNYLIENEKTIVITLPYEATEFIEEFDDFDNCPEERLKMQPFSFEIEISDEIIELMKFEQIEELKKCTTLELVD